MKCVFGSTLDRIDYERIDYEKIDSDIIDFERIDLYLDTILHNWLNKLNIVWIVLIKKKF